MTNIEFLLNYKKTQNEKLDIPLLKEITGFIESNPKLRDDVDIMIPFYQIKMLTDFDQNYYDKLKKLVTESSKKISYSQINEIIANLQNFCTKKILNGEVQYVEEEFEIALLSIKFNQIALNEKIPIDVFYKLFALGIALEKFDWARDFLEKYSKYLDEKFHNNAINYGTARLHYQNGEFNKALKDLSKIKNFSFIHYKPAVKILQLMIYYDLKFISEAQNIVNTFIQFLRNDKLLVSDVKKLYKNFLNVYSNLIKTETTGKKSFLNDLMHQIETQKSYLVGRKWLDQRARELESRIVKRKNKKAI